MGIRKINSIKENNNNIIKIVKESNDMYENEKYAYSLLKENIPKFIECDDNTNTIIIEKIYGKTLKEIEITNEIIVKLANAIKKIHNHIKDGKVFVHGDLHKENILYYNEEIYFIDFCCSRYDIPEVDYSALEIHVLDTKEKIDLFYKVLGINANYDLLKKEKVKHCLNHLTWATTDDFKNINIKSKRIIEENDELLEDDDFDYLGLIKLNNSENKNYLKSGYSPKEIKSTNSKNEYYLEKERNKIKNKIKKIESEIEQKENEIKEIEKEMQKEEISSDYLKLNELQETKQKLNKEIEKKMTEWEELNENL